MDLAAPTDLLSTPIQMCVHKATSWCIIVHIFITQLALLHANSFIIRSDVQVRVVDRSLERAEDAAAGVVVAGVVAAGGVGVAALVGGDHHAAVLRKPLHSLLHAAVAVGAPVVAPERMQMTLSRRISELLEP